MEEANVLEMELLGGGRREVEYVRLEEEAEAEAEEDDEDEDEDEDRFSGFMA